MKHIEDIELGSGYHGEVSIYEDDRSYYIDIKNADGEIIESRILEKAVQ